MTGENWILRLPDERAWVRLDHAKASTPTVCRGYVGSPVDVVTRNPHLAACWTSRAEAESAAKSLVGVKATPAPFDPEATAWFAAGRPID